MTIHNPIAELVGFSFINQPHNIHSEGFKCSVQLRAKNGNTLGGVIVLLEDYLIGDYMLETRFQNDCQGGKVIV